MIEEQVEGMRGEVHSIRLTGEIGADARIHERAVQSAAERLAAEASASDNRFDQIEADMKAAVAAIRWGGENIGIGSSRKMGWGRFELREFAAVAAAKAA